MGFLESKCFGCIYLVFLTLLEPSGLLSNNVLVVATRNWRHCYLNSETSASVARCFLIISDTVSSVATPIFNILQSSPILSDQVV